MTVVARAVVNFMNSGPAMPGALVYLALAAIPVTLLHELGHAVVARRLLGGEVSVTVGTAGRLAELQLGHIRVSINALSHPGRRGGVATFDASRARARDIVWI